MARNIISDEKWAIICSVVADSRKTNRGRPRRVDIRMIVEGILYVLSNHPKSSYIPKLRLSTKLCPTINDVS